MAQMLLFHLKAETELTFASYVDGRSAEVTPHDAVIRHGGIFLHLYNFKDKIQITDHI